MLDYFYNFDLKKILISNSKEDLVPLKYVKKDFTLKFCILKILYSWSYNAVCRVGKKILFRLYLG